MGRGASGTHRYNFDLADRYVAFGEKNKMDIVGHTLVWHVQTPDWVFQDESGKLLSREALARTDEGSHPHGDGPFNKGRIHGWDVVNEAIDEDGQFRKSKWLEIIGEDYVQKAFEYAYEADPKAQLYYNDYNSELRPKCEGIIRLVKNLQSRSVHLDGIGIQGHMFLDYPTIEELESSILTISKLGVKLHSRHLGKKRYVSRRRVGHRRCADGLRAPGLPCFGHRTFRSSTPRRTATASR